MATFEQLSLHYSRGYVIANTPIETYKTYSVTLPDTLLRFYAEKLIERYRELLPDAPVLTLSALYDEIGVYDNAPNQPRFSKRLSRWAHERGYEIPKHELSLIANFLAEASVKGTFYFQFSEVVDWNRGQFGDHHSCFFGIKRGALGTLHNAGARPVRFYLDEFLDKPLGRCFLLPLDDESFVVFNTYDASLRQSGYSENGAFSNSHAAAILAQFFGKTYVQQLDAAFPRSIRASRLLQNVWYNSSYVYLVGRPLKSSGDTQSFQWRIENTVFHSWFKPRQTCACNGTKHSGSCPICTVINSRVCACCGRLAADYVVVDHQPICINCLTAHYAYSFMHGTFVFAPDEEVYKVYDYANKRVMRVLPHSTIEPVVVNSVFGRHPALKHRDDLLFMRLQTAHYFAQAQFERLEQTYNQRYAPIDECRHINDVWVYYQDIARYVIEQGVVEEATKLLSFEDYIAVQRILTNRSRGAVPLTQ